MNLQAMPILDLLRLHSSLLTELKDRKIVGTRDNPTGGYAEWLVSNSYNLERKGNSYPDFDAIDLRTRERYQIKGAVAQKKGKPKLGEIRRLEPKGFDFLVAVIFSSDFMIRDAFKIPHDVILQHAKQYARDPLKKYRLYLADDLLSREGVECIRNRLLPCQDEASKSPV